MAQIWPDSVQRWRDRGRVHRIGGMEVFVVEQGSDDADDVVLVLHGFPTSSHDWHRALPHMGDGSARRFVLFDMPGYGLSDKPADYSYSLIEQADVTEMLLPVQTGGAIARWLDAATSAAA